MDCFVNWIGIIYTTCETQCTVWSREVVKNGDWLLLLLLINDNEEEKDKNKNYKEWHWRYWINTSVVSLENIIFDLMQGYKVLQVGPYRSGPFRSLESRF